MEQEGDGGMETVLVDRRAGWMVLTLNRPARLNAFNEEMHLALRRALEEAAGDAACRAVLLTGAGRAFCAGQDLAERVQTGGAPDLGASLDRLYNPLVRQLRALDKPVVCAVNGVAAGAGANIALACDIVLAARSATFIQAFSNIGLIPDSGGTFFLPRLIGDARARALALLGLPLDAATAAQWGLIWAVAEDEALAGEAEAITARLAARATHALGLVKQALNASPGNTLDQQLDLERDLQRLAGYAPDYAEGVRAFTQKRPPVFSGQPGRVPEA